MTLTPADRPAAGGRAQAPQPDRDRATELLRTIAGIVAAESSFVLQVHKVAYGCRTRSTTSNSSAPSSGS
jgi:hypothetical protein